MAEGRCAPRGGRLWLPGFRLDGYMYKIIHRINSCARLYVLPTRSGRTIEQQSENRQSKPDYRKTAAEEKK